jgi:hypothetical protein
MREIIPKGQSVAMQLEDGRFVTLHMPEKPWWTGIPKLARRMMVKWNGPRLQPLNREETEAIIDGRDIEMSVISARSVRVVKNASDGSRT